MGCATWAGFRCRLFITGARVGALGVMIVWRFITKTINDCVEAFSSISLNCSFERGEFIGHADSRTWDVGLGRYMMELMVFVFARAFIGGNQVCIEFRENYLDRWGEVANGERSGRRGISGSGRG